MSLLECRSISVRYGGVVALSDVDLTIDGGGEIVGLIGANGAGKTTFIDAVTGFTRCSGQVLLDGADISAHPPHTRSHRGLSRSWQSVELFDDLTVEENIDIATEVPPLRQRLLGRRARGGDGDAAVRSVDAVVELLDIADIRRARTDELSYGQRKLVGLARALVGRTRVICMDEPAAGLDAAESQDLGARLATIAGTGVAILLIDHDMSLVLGVCHQVHVLDFGRVIARGTPRQIQGDRAVISAYLGTEASAAGTPS